MSDHTRVRLTGDAVERAVVTGGAPPMEVASFAQALIRPQQSEKLPPCCAGCAAGADVRRWIAVVAQREKLGLFEPEAFALAWDMVTAVNPFPATLGRICPHPCEMNCSRKEKDGAVAINALERFLGDWALKQQLPLSRLEQDVKPESIGVIGAGPAGLSFAYQMARRGYRVTIYEKEERPGGMLYYGIPQYRLPEEVLDAEIGRILNLGVELKLSTAIGRDISVQVLRERHNVLFLGIGAGHGRPLGIGGEEGSGVWTGVEYLAGLNRGEPCELGMEVIVVGGGNTAVDAARAARRQGARVTMLYRRTRKEMPAIESEIDDALAEGVGIEYLAAPVNINRDGGKVRAIVVQRMALGEPDSSGRSRPVPLPDSEYEMPADSVIAAVSQEPDWDGLSELDPGTIWVQAAANGELERGLWAGGDTRGPGFAGLAIAQGRQAAEAVHAQLRGLEPPLSLQRPALADRAVKADYHPERKPAVPRQRAVDERLAQPDAEVRETISYQEFLDEVSRCFSCGLCYGCEYCFMYCNAGAFARLQQVEPGTYFALRLDDCEGCGKCIDLCPSGFLTPR